jgi:hypothetical protein
LQQIISHGPSVPAEILAADSSANKKNSYTPAVQPLFSADLCEKQQGSARAALSPQNNSLPPLDEIRMPVRYHKARDVSISQILF